MNVFPENDNIENSNVQVESTEIIPADTVPSDVVAASSLDLTERELISKIIEAPSKDELQKQFELFNINQSKKNALRIVKLNNLLDKVEDQAIERFEKRPDQVSNKELLEYMNVISGQIDRAKKNVDSISATPAIAVSAQKTDVTINVGSDLDRDSKERVMNVISSLLKQVKNQTNIVEVVEESDEIYEATFEDTSEPTESDNIIEE